MLQSTKFTNVGENIDVTHSRWAQKQKPAEQTLLIEEEMSKAITRVLSTHNPEVLKRNVLFSCKENRYVSSNEDKYIALHLEYENGLSYKREAEVPIGFWQKYQGGIYKLTNHQNWSTSAVSSWIRVEHSTLRRLKKDPFQRFDRSVQTEIHRPCHLAVNTEGVEQGRFSGMVDQGMIYDGYEAAEI
ncbi:hypothetical protein P879_11187 [Paragonimus westermani]|uniref:Uncharacterized protein n=1 Tax=Paragonimus westermani TaxID=34504 RepID=A0A8T0D9N5_9TREM|nr:hypothetical protein P879_11187 [Paragonimus westermani]